MSAAAVWIIRYIHIAFAVSWVGGAALWVMIIAPNVLQRGPPPIRRPFLEAVFMKVTRFFITAAIMTILSGLALMGTLVGFSNMFAVFQGAGGYPSGYGIALGIGLIAALIMAYEGLGVITPTSAKMLKTMQSLPANAPPPPEAQAELAKLGKRVGIAGLTTLTLGFIALGCMVWAVNTVR